MDTNEIKLECLKLAVEKQPVADADKAVETAALYWEWLTSAFPPSSREGTHNKD